MTPANTRYPANSAASVDPHHHFWRLDRQHQTWRTPKHGAIAADYGPTDLADPLVDTGVDATVLVQSVDSAEENARLADYAASAAFVAGVVGWCPLREPGPAAAELDRLRTTIPRLRGVRCLVGHDPLDWVLEPGPLRAFHAVAREGLSWDVAPVTAQQAAAVTGLARRVPELRVVVDHLGRPPVEAGGWEPWASSVAELASCPNVAMKVSIGIDLLTAWERWDVRPLHRYIEHTVETFGPARLMLASNWPVVLLRRDYVGAWRDLIQVVADSGLSGPELDDVRGGTARRWYRIGTEDGRQAGDG